MLKPTRCAFCAKDVVAPCDSTMLSDRCSQRVPPATGEPTTVRIMPKPAPADNGALAAVAEALAPAPPVTTEAPPAFTKEEAVEIFRKATTTPVSPMKVQIGGDHYKKLPIQPITFIQANKLGWEEGNVVKYVARWRDKNGIEDLKKARDILDKKIAFEEAQAKTGLMEYLSVLFKSV